VGSSPGGGEIPKNGGGLRNGFPREPNSGGKVYLWQPVGLERRGIDIKKMHLNKLKKQNFLGGEGGKGGMLK